MNDHRYDTVLSTCDREGIRTISLNRPQQLNAMNRVLVGEVAEAFEEADADPGTKAIIFTGEGRAFCAGDDRREHAQPANSEEATAQVDAIQRVTRAIVRGSKPVVGAIHGWAVGGGFEWAINCDFPIWAESAKAFFPEVSLNVFVTGGVSSILPALVGLNKAREMLFFGNHYTANELADAGVAWKVVPDESLMGEAYSVARTLSALPPASVRAMKRVLNQVAFTSIDRALELETEATVAAFLDPETTQRLKDF